MRPARRQRQNWVGNDNGILRWGWTLCSFVWQQRAVRRPSVTAPKQHNLFLFLSRTFGKQNQQTVYWHSGLAVAMRGTRNDVAKALKPGFCIYTCIGLRANENVACRRNMNGGSFVSARIALAKNCNVHEINLFMADFMWSLVSHSWFSFIRDASSFSVDACRWIFCNTKFLVGCERTCTASVDTLWVIDGRIGIKTRQTIIYLRFFSTLLNPAKTIRNWYFNEQEKWKFAFSLEIYYCWVKFRKSVRPFLFCFYLMWYQSEHERREMCKL